MQTRACSLLFAALLCAAAAALAQIPEVLSTAQPDNLGPARQWVSVNGYHAAYQEIESVLSHLRTTGEKRDANFLLTQCSFEDQQYEDAYEWSTAYLHDYPNDARYPAALLMQGVSAFQTRRLEEARRTLTSFIDSYPSHPKIGAAYFWRAMGVLDAGNSESAETDLRHAYENSPGSQYRDIALAGWALSLERRGANAEAITQLEKFLSEFPSSPLLPGIRIRLASLLLRTGETGRAAEILQSTRPRGQDEEEHALLRAEADLRLQRYEKSQIEYEDFVRDFPDARSVRDARFSIAWARMKRGDAAGAQVILDSLAKGHDSLALASLYQSGILALLRDRPADADSRLNALLDRSPYDDLAESSYYELGLQNYREKHPLEARRYFQLAARMFPGSKRQPESYHMLGETNVVLGDFSNAEFDFGQVRRLGGSGDLLSQSMYQQGVCLYHLGRFKSSAELFKQFLAQFSRDPRAGEVYVWMGEALFQDYRFDEAEDAYAKALRLFPSNPKRAEAAYGIAWSLFEQKKFSEAAADFDRFTTDYPDSKHTLDASLRKADCYFFMGQYERASQLYASLASERTDSRTIEYAEFQVAMSYIQRGESERGIQELRNFLTKFPQSVYDEVVQFNIGWEFFSREEYPLAITEFRTLMQKYPYSQLLQRVLFNMGDAYYNLKQYDSSRVYYQRVIHDYPQSLLVSDAINGLQFTYEAQGKPAGALAEIDTLLRTQSIQTPSEDLELRKGDILFGEGDFGSAVQEYQRVLAGNPAHAVRAKALHQLGRAYELEDNLPRAITYYKQVAKDFTDADVAPAATLELGIAYVKQKSYADAAATLKPFETTFPGSPLLSEAEYYSGVALAHTGEENGAMRQFQSLLEKFPADVFADRSRLQIADILHDRKEHRAAIDTLAGILNRRSDDIAAEALNMIGDNYLAMRKYTDALQSYNDVIRQYTEFPLMIDRARLGLGTAYEKLGERFQARAAYQELLKSGVDPVLKNEAQQRLKKIKR